MLVFGLGDLVGEISKVFAPGNMANRRFKKDILIHSLPPHPLATEGVFAIRVPVLKY